LKRVTEIIEVHSLGDIPSIATIMSTPRERVLQLKFSPTFNKKRTQIGQDLKSQLTDFKVSVHSTDPVLNVAKLISDKEIEDNQDFFEQCAKDYRNLSRKLIYDLSNELSISIDPDYPLRNFNPLKRDERSVGFMKNWRYNLHGFHCGFENQKTGQEIEVPLVFGLEFGDLDPYFFTRFIRSTKDYEPIPVLIHDDYHDGVKINEKMLSLGKFEKINSNVGNHYGIVVSDRDKVEIKTIDQLNNSSNEIFTVKKKFNFWKFIGLKK